MPCLKRRLSDAVYRQLLAEHHRRPQRRARRGPGTALRGVTAIQRGRPDPARRHFSHNPNPHPRRYLRPLPPDSPTGPGTRAERADAPEASTWSAHRTNDVDADQRRRTLEDLPDRTPLTDAAIEGRLLVECVCAEVGTGTFRGAPVVRRGSEGPGPRDTAAVNVPTPALSLRVDLIGRSVPAGVAVSEVRRCAVPGELVFTVDGSTATPAVPITLADAGLRERSDLQ